MALTEAVALLRAGELVAFPTETVYGLGGHAGDPSAVRHIFEAKGRPSDHPLIVHLASADALSGWATAVPPEASELSRRFWPGPLTLILERTADVPDAVTGGLDTVALRVPKHPVALELLRRFGGGIAAPSANRFGRVSPTTAQHVREELDGRVAMILDGGACAVGLESTIVDVSGSEPALLRPGGISREQLEHVLGRPIAMGRQTERVRSPGLLPSHYAPRARVTIASAVELPLRVEDALRAGRRVGVLAAPPLPSLPEAAARLLLPARPAEAAAVLYDRLREADRRALDLVVAVPPSPTGIGLAIADRLMRAASPRT